MLLQIMHLSMPLGFFLFFNTSCLQLIVVSLTLLVKFFSQILYDGEIEILNFRKEKLKWFGDEQSLQVGFLGTFVFFLLNFLNWQLLFFLFIYITQKTFIVPCGWM